ncbi:MAG: shikimate kinase [Candidatus Reconcilbacillus cellulovorans]|uniref:Shikimate kinase n=1 Tax=Candidatus Reconcilbacillus cellulovorans TaxID=1906605 RepID=A0A2A6E456_9BACL|nr:MAG: shikimate kinase [Candidatus Reconcilbacillus cellulovorans]
MSGEHIVLVGFMGTGKSTVGALLASRLGRPFVDTDRLVEETAGMSVSDIFERYGEAEFRRRESEALVRALAGEPAVVATGGGAVLSEANRRAMTGAGFVVALVADPEVLTARLGRGAGRPLLSGDVRERVFRLLEERRHAYDFADLRVDTSHLSPEQVARKILEVFWSRKGENRP